MPDDQTSAIRAIETEYAGYCFRSRLEARWAVFFDQMGYDWVYEPEGYERRAPVWKVDDSGEPVKDSGEPVEDDDSGEPVEDDDWSRGWIQIGETVVDRYLPDFVLRWGSGEQTFAEVKGDPEALRREWKVHADRHDFGGILPKFADSVGSRRGLLLLGEIPDATEGVLHFHPILQHHKGLTRSWFTFDRDGITILRRGEFLESLEPLREESGLESDGKHWLIETRQLVLQTDPASNQRGGWHYRSVRDAYLAARQARFEHGETPARPKRAPPSSRA